MITNLVDYVKNQLFANKIEKTAIVSDTQINTSNSFYKFDIIEPVWQILALAKKYKFVFVVLDRLNWDNIFRLYKNLPDNICVLNLNAWYTGLWYKIILADMDDIYINPYVDVKEPMDLENLKMFINNFLENKKLTHIRIPSKDMMEKIWNENTTLDYNEIINFNEFGISWFSWAIIAYWSILQETLNAVWLLQSEWYWVDLYWIWDYKKMSVDLINHLDNQDKVFIVWDFDPVLYKDYFYSKFFQFGLKDKEIHFICPMNLRQTLKEFLSETVKMQPVDIYNRIREKI